MGRFFGKAMNLVFDRRAVSRPNPADLTRIEWRALDVGGYDPVSFSGRLRNETGHLRVCYSACHEIKRDRNIIGPLLLKP